MSSHESEERPDDSIDTETDDLGDFDEFQNDDADVDDESNAHASAVAETLAKADDEDLEAAGIDPDDLDARRTTIELAPEPVDPLADDFQIGDPAIDTATGRSVVIVDRAADRTDDHSEREGYDFLDNYGNQRTRARAADPVYTAVYVSSLQSKPTKSYDFPSSRLGRPEYENVDGVDRVYEMVARDLLERLFVAGTEFDVDAIATADGRGVVQRLALEAGVDEDVVDEARELADVETDFGGKTDDE